MSAPLITLAIPYYRQKEMLRKQIETWRQYEQEARDAIYIIVVDDGSPEPAEDVIRRSAPNGRGPDALLRIKEDIPWNRGCARNLATQVCTTPWILHADTDHVLPPDSALALVRMHAYLNAKHWYRFRRFRVGAADETRKKDKVNPAATFAEIHPHIDSYLCTPKAYWRAGGYNTRFSGVLGGGSPFLKEMEKANGVPRLIEFPLHVHTRNSVYDASECTLPRDPEAFARRKRDIMAKFGTLRADPLEAVTSPWERVL